MMWPLRRLRAHRLVGGRCWAVAFFPAKTEGPLDCTPVDGKVGNGCPCKSWEECKDSCCSAMHMDADKNGCVHSEATGGQCHPHDGDGTATDCAECKPPREPAKTEGKDKDGPKEGTETKTDTDMLDTAVPRAPSLLLVAATMAAAGMHAFM